MLTLVSPTPSATLQWQGTVDCEVLKTILRVGSPDLRETSPETVPNHDDSACYPSPLRQTQVAEATTGQNECDDVEEVESPVQVRELIETGDVEAGALEIALASDEADNSDNLPSPLEGASSPQNPASWLDRLPEILLRQTNSAARQIFWEQVPSLAWSPARVAGQKAGDIRPSPPDSTPSRLSFITPDVALPQLPSSPPFPSTEPANTPELDSFSAERTPSPVVTPTPAGPSCPLKKQPKVSSRKPHRDPTFRGVNHGRVHKTYPLRNNVYRRIANGPEALLSKPPKRPRARPLEPCPAKPAPRNEQYIGDQVFHSYQAFPWIPVGVRHQHAPTEDECFDPFLVAAVPAAILTQETGQERDSVLKTISSWKSDWARTPWDLNDAHLDDEIANSRRGLKVIREEVAGFTHKLDVIRIIGVHARRAAECHALHEILLYGVLRVACYVLNDAREVRIRDRCPPPKWRLISLHRSKTCESRLIGARIKKTQPCAYSVWFGGCTSGTKRLGPAGR